MATAAKRVGRPARSAVSAGRAERYSLGLIVTAEMKRLIDETAKATGRTQSQVAELLMEKAVTYDRMIAAMNRSLDEIRRGNIEAAFRAEGYTPVHNPHGKIWLPPGYPIGARSGFIAPEEGQ
jgi:hypothetical protein